MGTIVGLGSLLQRLHVVVATAVALAAFLAAAPAAHAQGPEDPLVGQWHLDEDTPFNSSDPESERFTPDSSGEERDLRFPEGGATIVPDGGRFGGHLQQDSLGTLSAAPGEKHARVTLIAWIRASDFDTSDRVIAGRAIEGLTCQAMPYALYSDGSGGEGGAESRASFRIRRPDGVEVKSPAFAGFADGQWHMLAGVFDGSTVRLYVDGVQVGPGTPAGTTAIGYGTDERFGIDGYRGSCPAADFSGGIDEVREYSRALSPTEIGKLAAATGPNPPVLDPDPSTAKRTLTVSIQGPGDGHVVSSPAGIDCGSDCSQAYDHGTSVTLTAISGFGSTLRTWGGACAHVGGSQRRCTVTMDAAKHATAAFNPPPPPPTATFTAPDQVKANNPAIFDAGGSRNASKFMWDVNSDGKKDVVTKHPVLRFTPTAPGKYDVTLTTQSPTGQTASSSQPFRATGPKPITSVAGTPVGATFPDPRSAIAEEAGFRSCEQMEVIFWLMEARGCFTRVDSVDGVPSAERAVVRQHYQNQSLNKTVTVICNRAAAGELPQERCDAARKMFGAAIAPDIYVSKRPVSMNGVRITPVGNAYVVVYPKTERVVSSRAIVTWNGLPMGLPNKVDFNLNVGLRSTGGRQGRPTPKPTDPFPSGRAQLLTFDSKKALSNIGGFGVNGQASLAVETVNGRRSSTADMNLTLPSLFQTFGGGPPSIRVKLHANNDGGPTLDDLDAVLPEAHFGAIRLTNLSFKYRLHGGVDPNDRNPGTRCDHKEWKVRGDVFLSGLTGGGVKMTPPPPQNGLGFCGGDFKHFGAVVFPPEPKPVLGPGVRLNRVGFGVQIDPVVVRGDAGIEVVKIADVDGGLLVAFATPREPYELGPGEPSYFAELMGRRLQSFTVAVAGEVSAKVPVLGRIKLGNGAIMYSAPDFVKFGGSTKVNAVAMTFEGGMGGWLQARRKRFQLSGFVSGCINFPPPFDFLCRSITAQLGSKGVSSCMNFGGRPTKTKGVFRGGVNIGAGYEWGEILPTFYLPDGCKHSPYWEVETASASANSLTFTVAPGERRKFVRIRGRGGSPSIEVRAPGGEVLSTAKAPLVRTRTMAALRVDADVTFLGVKGGRPGTYTIRRLPGSVPLGRLAASKPGYDTEYKARVTGRGRVRTLVYDARRPGGQRVTFMERGKFVARDLLTVRGGRGKFRFRPKVAPGRARSIVAVSTLRGTPLPDKTLARFSAPGIPVTKRPRKVLVRRKGTQVRIRWKGVRGAKRYGVAVKLNAGRTRMFQVSGRRRSLRVKRVPRDVSGRVEVSAQGVLLDWGRPRTKRFKRLTRPFTVVQTDRNNEKLTAKREAAKRRKAAKRKRARKK